MSIILALRSLRPKLHLLSYPCAGAWVPPRPSGWLGRGVQRHSGQPHWAGVGGTRCAAPGRRGPSSLALHALFHCVLTLKSVDLCQAEGAYSRSPRAGSPPFLLLWTVLHPLNLSASFTVEGITVVRPASPLDGITAAPWISGSRPGVTHTAFVLSPPNSVVCNVHVFTIVRTAGYIWKMEHVVLPVPFSKPLLCKIWGLKTS